MEGEHSAQGERPDGFALPRAARITKSAELREMFRRGKRQRTRHLDVFVASSPVLHPRLGVVVPKHRQKIVRRNRLKRRLREIGRTVLLPHLRLERLHIDLLVRARREAYDAPFDQLRAELVAVVESLC